MRGTVGTASHPCNFTLKAGPHCCAAPATWTTRRSVLQPKPKKCATCGINFNSLVSVFLSGRVCTSFKRELRLDLRCLLAALCVSRTTSRRLTSDEATLRSCASVPMAGSSARRMVTVCACWRSMSTVPSWWTACLYGRLCCGRFAPSTLTATWCSPQSSHPLTVSSHRAALVDA